jgi:hypothetical protein
VSVGIRKREKKGEIFHRIILNFFQKDEGKFQFLRQILTKKEAKKEVKKNTFLKIQPLFSDPPKGPISIYDVDPGGDLNWNISIW